MQIETVELKNIGPHRALNVELSSGIVGIVGANGAGKSSLINAIYAALTGDFKRFQADTKADVINNQAAKHEKSFIKLTGTHAGKTFELVRSLRPNEATFKYGASEVETATQVNDLILKLMGLTQNVIDRYVFVNQWEMFSFLDDTESVRAKTFQHLCGVESAIGLHKACVAFKDKLVGKQTLDNSLDLENNISELQETVSQLKATKIKGLLTKAKVESLRSQWQAYRQMDQLQAAIAKANYAQSELQDLVKEKEAEFQKIEAQFTKATGWLEKYKQLCQTAEQTVRDRNARTRLQGSRDVFEQKIKLFTPHIEQTELQLKQLERKKVKFSAEEIPLKEAEWKLLASQIQALQASISNLEKGNKAVCSACRQDLPASHLQKLRDDLDELELQETRLAEDLEKSEARHKLTSHMLSQIKDWQKSVDEATASLKGLEGVSAPEVSDQSLENALTALRSRKAAEASYAKTKPEYESLKAELSGLRGRLTQNKLQLSDLESQLSVIVAKFGEINPEVKAKLDAHEKALLEQTRVQAEIEASSKQLLALQQTLGKLRATLAREAKMRQLAEIVDRVANTFHWSSLPKRVAQNNLVSLESHINEQLDLFNSPFLVETSDDLSFRVTFPGKPSVSAKQLSGGQKVILAIAFRAALDRLFGHNMGMLFLDEPLAGLDADNIAYFHDAMQSWSTNVGTQKQIVVITHVQDMTNAFDQIVTIEK